MSEYFERYVGSLTPREFVAPFADRPEPIMAAIEALIADWPWDCPVPAAFIPTIYDYVSAKLREEPTNG